MSIYNFAQSGEFRKSQTSMKLYVLLLYVVALLVLTGTTRGDEEGEATSPRVCIVESDKGTPMYLEMLKKAVVCLATDGTVLRQLKETRSSEGHKVILKSICDKRQQIRECLAGVEQTSEVCQNETGHQNFQIMRELLETLLDSGCIQDGEALATTLTIYKESMSHPFASDPFRDCVSTSIGRIGLLENKEFDLSSRFFILYRDALDIGECFGNIAEGDLDVSTNIKSIISEITNKMKCIHPHEATTVLCKTIDITLPDTPRLCPIRSQGEEKSPLYDMLLERLSWCFASSYILEYQDFNVIENLDLSRAYLKHYCDMKRIVGHCWSDVASLSSVCLNETQHNTIKMVEETLQNTFSYGCVEDGQDLAYVLFKVVNDSKTTKTDTHAILECLTVADRTHESGDKYLDADRVMVYYQQLNVFKDCFINKMRGDNTAVSNAGTFLTLVQRSMKCLDPEHGAVVPCETIDTTPPTGLKVCPFVGEHENEPPKYEIFVDLAFKCIKATTLDYDRLDNFTSIEEFQTFFKSFCHNRLSVTHCLADVSLNSEVCQNQTMSQVFNIFTDFLESVLETGCKQDGEVLATILDGMDDAKQAVDTDHLTGCLDSAGRQIKNSGLHSDALSAKTLLIYRGIESLKECVSNAASDAGSFKTVFASFMNEILRDLKCIRPEDGTTVLCETIVNN